MKNNEDSIGIFSFAQLTHLNTWKNQQPNQDFTYVNWTKKISSEVPDEMFSVLAAGTDKSQSNVL